MPALFERALGDAWPRLDTQIQNRYGLVASENRMAVGRGEMVELGGSRLVAPVLWPGVIDDVLFPESGQHVPFEMYSIPFVDANGYNGLVLERHFETEPPRTFADTIRWNPARGCITDLLGRRGYICADIHLAVDDGTLVLTIGRQWLRVGDRFVPIPEQVDVDGTLRDWYDTAAEQFEVTATVTTMDVDIFGYRGHFENTFREHTNTEHPPLADTPLPGSNRTG